MSYRKNLIKKRFLGRFGFGSITKKDFVEYATRFEEIFESVCGPSTIRIELYAKMPYFTSFIPSDSEMETQKKFNEEGMQVLTELSELPKDFSGIPYIKVILCPQNESKAPAYAFGVVDFGKRLPSHIRFYAQPEEIVKIMKKQLFPENKAPKGFSLGDGLERNTGYYVPHSVIGSSVLPEILTSINLENHAPEEFC